MVLQGLLGGALAYANTAYTYNLGRYEFDSNQAQTSAHQLMNFRLAQWNLFREDIRDLFTLTTSHMSTYMVVGTLFLGFTVSFVWSGIKDFPVNPPWLLLLWGNCFISSLSYGVLSVWLAMHGSITANSSSVRVLAQFIRPPIPTAEELRTACYALGGYEAGGMKTLLKPPDLLGARSKAQNMFSRMSQRGASAEVAGDDGASSVNGGSAGSHAQSEVMSSGAPRNPSPRRQSSTGMASASQATSQPRPPPPVALAGLYDAIGSPIGSGPGRAATLESHIQLFRKEQATFLSFDAYARVCLAGCASQLLLAFAYFIIAYTLDRFTQKTVVRWAAAVFCWGCTSMIIFTSLSLFKLDLYVERATMRSVKSILVSGPLFTSIAAQMWIQSDWNHLVWLLVMLATVLHIAWAVIFLYEARPVGYFQLPMSFRSVRYLDIFGYATEEAPQGLQRGQVPSDLPQVREDEQRAEAEGLEEALKRLLQPCGYAEQLSEGERQRLQEMYQKCQSSGPRRRSIALPTLPVIVGRWWLRCEHVADSGQPLPYYVNAWTSEVRWEAPEGAHIISMSGESAQSFLGEPPPDLGLETEALSSFHAMAALEVEGPTNEATAPRRPGSKYNQASMPWKYFMQLTLFMIALWCSTLIYVIVDRHYLLASRRPSDAQRLAFAWPHEFFSPVALACEGGRLFLGDRFEVYAGELPVVAPPGPAGRGEGAAPWPLKLQLLLRAEDLPGPWQSFAALCGDSDGPGGCSALLLLDQEGRTVWERPLPGHGAVAAAPRSWPLGAGLSEPLRTIGLLDGRVAAGHCGGCRVPHNASAAVGEADWALLGVTESGEAIVLCPRGGRLQPARRIARRPQAQEPGQEEDEELLAVHSDAAGRRWLLARAAGGGAALRCAAAAAGAGAPAREHALPSGRRWARGLCEVRRGFLLAAEAEQPELWYLPLPGGGASDRRAGLRARQPVATLEVVV